MPFRTLGAICLLLIGCHQATFTEVVSAANRRWEVAICRTPRYRSIRYERSVTRCGLDTGDFLGCYDHITGEVKVSRTTEAHKLLQVVTHELGHSFTRPGQHVVPHKGIMSAYVSEATPNITAADIALLCQEYDCPCSNPELP